MIFKPIRKLLDHQSTANKNFYESLKRNFNFSTIFLLIFGVGVAFFAFDEKQRTVPDSYFPALLSSLNARDIYFQDTEDLYTAVEKGLRQKDPYLQLYKTGTEFSEARQKTSSGDGHKYGIRFNDETGLVTGVVKHSANTGRVFIGDMLLAIEKETDPKNFLRELQKRSLSHAKLKRKNGAVEEIKITSQAINPFYAELNTDNTEATITIYNFTSDVSIPLARWLKTLPNSVDHLIFDIRDCPGGKLITLNAVLSLFLPNGSLLYTEVNKNKTQQHITSLPPLLNLTRDPVKVTVLKSNRTASAAEIFIGVLKHYVPTDRLELIGDTTYGKWTSTQFIAVGKGGYYASVGRICLPDGSSYEGKGI